MSSLSIGPLEKALEYLVVGYKDKPSDLERDGLIQRFEYCFELCWKTAKRVLKENGIESDSPKAIFRELASLGWIESAEPWFEFLNARNLTSHIYKQEVANEVFSQLTLFMSEAQKLKEVLRGKM